MSNQEVMVVLNDDGKPVTVIRALDDDDDVISRDQRPTAAARVSADVKRNSNRYRSLQSSTRTRMGSRTEAADLSMLGYSTA